MTAIFRTLFCISVLACSSLNAAEEAGAFTLKFDELSERHDGDLIIQGYRFSLNGGENSHFNDYPLNGVLFFHDGGSNAFDAVMTMERIDGRPFDFLGFQSLVKTPLFLKSDLRIHGEYTRGSFWLQARGIRSMTFDMDGRGPNKSAVLDNIIVRER